MSLKIHFVNTTYTKPNPGFNPHTQVHVDQAPVWHSQVCNSNICSWEDIYYYCQQLRGQFTSLLTFVLRYSAWKPTIYPYFEGRERKNEKKKKKDGGWTKRSIQEEWCGNNVKCACESRLSLFLKKYLLLYSNHDKFWVKNLIHSWWENCFPWKIKVFLSFQGHFSIAQLKKLALD